MRLHAIDVAADDLIVLAEADIVILAAPVKQNLALLEELDANVHQAAIVTDTGSTKRDIVGRVRGAARRGSPSSAGIRWLARREAASNTRGRTCSTDARGCSPRVATERASRSRS